MADRALVFDIKRDSSEDGPGIRTTVFFKGCPLACAWCQNPEGIGSQPALSFDRKNCHPDRCGAPCVKVCREGCLRIKELEHGAEQLELRRSGCTRCEDCVKICPYGALQNVGDWLTLDQLLYRISVDEPFYNATGGGVTLSGGEPTAQMDFLGRLLRALEELGTHTAIETCGMFDYERFARLVLPHVDLIYFDLKIFDDAASRRHTGRSNRPAFDNFARLVRESSIPVIPRIALVPGITATRRNIMDLAAFLRSLGLQTCSLLPYNPLWMDKIARLGKRAQFERHEFMSREEINACVDWLLEGADRHVRASDSDRGDSGPSVGPGPGRVQ